MPAGYTHYNFGELVFEKLDPSLQDQLRPYIDLYHIGIHGPDILFYHQVYKRNKVNQLGSTMHYDEAYPFFMEAKHLIQQSSQETAALAYIAGFITHFILDSECHPYIYQLQDELHKTHSEIESELDREIIVREGKDPLTISMTAHLHPSHEIDAIIAPFFHLEKEEIDKTLNDMLFYLGWIRAPGHIKRYFVYEVMKLGGIYDQYSGLLISYQRDEELVNSVDELIKKKDQSVDLAVKMIEEYVDHLHDEYLNERFKRNYE